MLNVFSFFGLVPEIVYATIIFQLLPKIGSLLQDVMSLMRAVYLEQSRRIIKSDRYQR